MAAVIRTWINILLHRSIYAAILRTQECRGPFSSTPLSLDINMIEATAAYLALSR